MSETEQPETQSTESQVEQPVNDSGSVTTESDASAGTAEQQTDHPSPAEPASQPAEPPALPDDHPLSYLGGEYRVIAGYLHALEQKVNALVSKLG